MWDYINGKDDSFIRNNSIQGSGKKEQKKKQIEKSHLQINFDLK